MNLYLLSRRNIISSVSQDPIFELENIIARSCSGTILIPTARGLLKWSVQLPLSTNRFVRKVLNKTIGLYQLQNNIPQFNSSNRNVLLVIAISGAELDLLSTIPNWRQRFDVVIAYIFDAWGAVIYSKNVYKLDHLFVPLPEVIDDFKKKIGIEVSLIPFGADVLNQGSGQVNRIIDITNFGRIPQQYNQYFFRQFNHRTSERIYYNSTPRKTEIFPKDPYENRKDEEDTLLLFHILRKTKLMLAFDTMYPGMRKFPYSFITLRWFYGAATGCAIIGKRPTTPLVDELFNWEDSTIELPDDPQKSVELVEELLKDTKRLHSIHRRNYTESCGRHDWRFRIQDMYEKMKIPLPQSLTEELSQLKTLYSQMLQQ
ncbi:MAG: glycosyltransferase [Microcoleaceae cyanobacterium]